MPKYNSISISGYHMQEAGATGIHNDDLAINCQEHLYLFVNSTFQLLWS